jgi:hypothetical protein
MVGSTATKLQRRILEHRYYGGGEEMKPQQQRDIINRLVAEQVARQAQKWRTQTAQQVYAVILIILHDKYEFTPEQLKRVIEEITEKFDCIADRYVRIEDFYGLLQDMGIEVTE